MITTNEICIRIAEGQAVNLLMHDAEFCKMLLADKLDAEQALDKVEKLTRRLIQLQYFILKRIGKNPKNLAIL